MAGFTVSPGLLAELCRDLRACGDELDQGLGALKGAGRGGLGHDALEDAGRHFQEKWAYGLGKVRESVTLLVEGLEKAQREYDGTEQSLTGALGR